MRRRYQISKQRALEQFRRLASEKNPSLQMVLPLAQVVAWLQQGVGHLLRQAGLELMSLVVEEEVKQLCGERHQQHAARQAHRWGKEAGYCVVDGQKVPIQRTRVRCQQSGEVPLGSYELFRRNAVLDESVWSKMLLGLSTRNYGEVVKDFTTAYGVEKSATSEHFIVASREKLKGLMERKLSDLRLCAMLIDGTEYKQQHFIVALGIGYDGRKTVLGLRQGATENATVVGELFKDLQERGVDFSQPRLYVLDGSPALHKAVRQYAGENALIQRCQLHIADRDPRFPEGWNVPSRASPYEPGSLGSGMAG